MMTVIGVKSAALSVDMADVIDSLCVDLWL